MLDTAVKQQLATHFEKVIRPVELVASLDDSPRSAQLAELLDELAEQSEHLTVVRRDDNTRRPSFSVASAETGEAVRFAGLPLGHEFTSLILAVLQVGGHPSTAAAELIDQVQSLDGELRFETFFSQSCQNCPDVVQALNLMSVLNPGISHVAIDGAAFQDEASEREVLAVPTVFLNGEPFGQGRMTLEEIVNQIDAGSSERRRAEIEALAEEPFDVLVVGGGPAGASAAIYAARKGIRTAVVAERFGGQVLDTMSIENLISVPSTDGPRVAAALEEHVKTYEVDLINSELAAKLVPGDQPGDLVSVELASGPNLTARTVVLSTGARWRNLGVPGEAELRNKGVTYCPHCDGPLFAGKRVAVIGGGNSGVEAAIDLSGVVGHVTLIEFDDQLRADEVLQRKLRSLSNTDVIVGARTTEILGTSHVTGLTYEDRASGEVRTVDLDGVFVQIGLLPNTEWLAGSGVELSPRGEIEIDDKGATSAYGVFAAGDCTTVPYKQIVIALGAGSTAALGAFDYLIRTTAPAEAAVA